jgi:predicted HicB family RNase H-like nuclease
MFEVKKEEMANKTFRLPVDLIKRLETVAQQKGVSTNNLVRQCCEYALEHLKTEHAPD